MSANTIKDFTSISITLCASFDLHAAGEDNSDEAISDFEDAYAQCADFIAKESGVSIDITHTRYDGPDCGNDPHEGEFGGDLWQNIHDCLDNRDGEWKYSKSEARKVADALHRDAVDGLAEVLSAKANEVVSDMVREELDGEADSLIADVIEKLTDR